MKIETKSVAVGRRMAVYRRVLLCFSILLPLTAWSQSSGNAEPSAPEASSSSGAPGPTICGITCEEANQAPNVQLTSPTNGSTANAPATIALAALASDDQMVASVEFYCNGVPIGEDSTYPFSMSYGGLAPGSYSFTAIATDNLGESGQSNARTVTVTIPPNNAPVIILTAPSNGATATAPASVMMTASATDGDGVITKVEFKSGAALICTDTTSPYSCSYSSMAAGSYAISAAATDNWGAVGTSATATVTVSGATPAPVSETRAYVYDSNERLCKTINPESGASVVDYDAAGNILWTADGTALTSLTCDRASVSSLQKSTRSYDAMNRLVAVSTPGGKADITTSYHPDGLVNALTAANPGGYSVVTAYTYNKRRLLVGEKSTNGATVFTLGYAYNANGHLGTVIYPDNQSVSYAPDALGRATQVAVPGGATYASGIGYHPSGAISGFAYGNGVVHTLTQNARRLPARSRDAMGAITILDDSYSFDPNGNVTDITDQAQNGRTTRGMGYDKLDRLTAVVSPGQWGTATYAYDGLDNLVAADQGARQFRYNYNTATRRLSSIKSPAGATLITLGYDARGNTTSKNTQALVFDSANRLNQVTGQQTYRYDGQGRRVQTTDADGKTTFWIYGQSGQVLYTSEARRSRNLSYVYLGNTQVATRAVAWTTGTTTVSYQHTDALGSPMAESNSSGVVTKRNSYAPYGEAYGATSIDGAGYTGHVMDLATGLVYMQQRYYDPAIGRFLSVDPVTVRESGDNFNRYNYASNNPYKFTDPDGRESGCFVNGVGCGLRAKTAEDNRQTAVAFTGLVVTTLTAGTVGPGAAAAAGQVSQFGLLGAVLANPVAIRVAAFVGLDLAAGVASNGGAPSSTAPLASRVGAINGVLDPIAQSRRTTAVLATTSGTRIAAAGGRDLSPAQRAALMPGEVAARSPGAHAEVTALQHAAANGMQPAEISASRPFCTACAGYIEQSGGLITSPTTATW